ncbi:hypothetical protein AHAS_Ahas15G0201500 [Arachis hypogaea]
MMSQQRDYESRSLVMQGEQASQSQEYFNQLAQLQVENMRAFNEFQTLQDARYGVQADYNINSQVKLNYIAEHLHTMDPAFLTYDEYFEGRSEREICKAIRLENRVEKTMKKAGFWQKLKGKGKGETSKGKHGRRLKKEDVKDKEEATLVAKFDHQRYLKRWKRNRALLCNMGDAHVGGGVGDPMLTPTL